MKFLLDTHVAIWSVSQSHRLPAQLTRLLLDRENTVFVSVISVFEIAIKNTQGRRTRMPFSSEAALQFFGNSEYRMLDVTASHAQAVENLPPIHPDPFDRLIVAQALTEPLRLITHDRQVAAYSDSIILF